MKKSKLKRVLSVVLVTVMVAGTIAFTPQVASRVQAAETATVKNINLGTGGFSSPSRGSDGAWTGSRVYFGLDTTSTIPKVNSDNSVTTGDYTKTTPNNLWRVLDASSGLLFADDIIAERRYDDRCYDWDETNDDWDETNELYNWLNGTTYKTNSDKFTTIEQGAIATNTDGDMRLLTIDEVKNTAYGFTNEEAVADSARAASSWWWLRSSGNYINLVLSVDNGEITMGPMYDDLGSVRPAFNLNLDSVLFTSASSASKSSFEAVGTDKVDTNIWKLTLKDSSKTVSVTSGESVLQNGQTVTVPYTYTGDDVSQISIMITDKAYTESDASILYYGALDTTLATTGTGTVTLPKSLPEGYKIYMMAEDVNNEKLTDYSSTPVEIVPTLAYDVIVNNGTGDGSYASGATVTITADTAPSGQEFDKWTVVSGGVTLVSATSVTTTFEMPANAVEVTATYKNKPSDPNSPAPTPTYTITAGAGETHELSTTGTLMITCDGALDKLTGIYVDDKLVDEANYTLKAGSTILTFKAEYLNTLSVGTHTVKFQYTDESAETTFEIKETSSQNTIDSSERDEAPKTGDSTPIAGLFIAAMVSGAGVVYFGRKKKAVK